MGREFASAAARWCHLLDLPFRPQIVAVADPVEAARDWFTTNIPGAEGYADYQSMLASADIEAVYCAVPHHLHETVYVDCIRAGKHLMAEKPFGIDLPACERICAEVDAHPELLVRCSGQFPFFPGVQRIVSILRAGEFGRIFEYRGAFLHASDLDPTKPINWKRRIATNGEYGCMGDLGLHVCHIPIRFGLTPTTVFPLLSKVVSERPDGKGGMAACETWDNAILACRTEVGASVLLETKRIAPGHMNSWSLSVYGTEASAEFSTKYPKTLRVLRFSKGQPQAWAEEDLGYKSVYPSITGGIFEFGFSDAILQMWAAFCDELVNGAEMIGNFQCATPAEALVSHHIFTEALRNA